MTTITRAERRTLLGDAAERQHAVELVRTYGHDGARQYAETWAHKTHSDYWQRVLVALDAAQPATITAAEQRGFDEV